MSTVPVTVSYDVGDTERSYTQDVPVETVETVEESGGGGFPILLVVLLVAALVVGGVLIRRRN